MNITNIELKKLLKKEEDLFLSLFRIPLTFFSKEDDDIDDDDIDDDDIDGDNGNDDMNNNDDDNNDDNDDDNDDASDDNGSNEKDYDDPFNVDDEDDNKKDNDKKDDDKKDVDASDNKDSNDKDYDDPFNVDDEDDNKKDNGKKDDDASDDNDSNEKDYDDPFNVDDEDDDKKDNDKKDDDKKDDDKKDDDKKDDDKKDVDASDNKDSNDKDYDDPFNVDDENDNKKDNDKNDDDKKDDDASDDKDSNDKDYDDPFNVDDEDDNKKDNDKNDDDKKDDDKKDGNDSKNNNSNEKDYDDPFNVDDDKDSKTSGDTSNKNNSNEKDYDDPFNVDDENDKKDSDKKADNKNNAEKKDGDKNDTDKKDSAKTPDNKNDISKNTGDKKPDNKNNTDKNASDKKPGIKNDTDKKGGLEKTDMPGTEEGKKSVPGMDKMAKTKQGLDAIKNAKDDPMGTAEKLGTEAAKAGVKAAANAVAPGAGEVAAKAVELADKVLEKSETGRTLKKVCCVSCCLSSCMSVLVSAFLLMLPILIIIQTVDNIVQGIKSFFVSAGKAIASVFTKNEPTTDEIVDAAIKEAEEQAEAEAEPEDKSHIDLITALHEDTLTQAQTSLLPILEDALKNIGYYDDTVENSASALINIMHDIYSVNNLKEPVLQSATENHQVGPISNDNFNPYFSMQSKHSPLFQDVLDNLLESEYNKLSEQEKLNANLFKKLFNNDTEIVKFLDEVTTKLDKKYDAYIPDKNINRTVSLRDLFNELSVSVGDAEYDLFTVSRILGDSTNSQLIDDFYQLQEDLVKLEMLTYMQAYRQYNLQVSSLRNKAQTESYILPDIYFTDDFFNQFSTISNVASFMVLSLSCDEPDVIYEIARETINIYKDPIEVSVKTFSDESGSKNIGYIPLLKTWYGNYSFDLVQVGSSMTLQCTGVDSKKLEEQSWDGSSNLFERYNIDNKEQFFILYMEATGINPVEGVGNIYSPYEMDTTWQSTVYFNSTSGKANSSGTYSYTNSSSSYASYEFSNSIPYTYSTTTYLTPTGGSLPLATANLDISMGFMEHYGDSTIKKFGLTHSEHYGIDYSTPIGTPVLAMRGGTITKATFSNAYGYYVEIKDSSGYISKYAHGNGVFNVNVGDTVSAGTQLMESGNSGNSTGPHLHVEVHDASGTLVDPSIYAGLII